MNSVDFLGLVLLCVTTIFIAFFASVLVSLTGFRLTLARLRNIVVVALLAVMIFPADAILIFCLMLGIVLSYPYAKV